jgi:hypothetical protein
VFPHEVHITDYRSVEDSGLVPVERDVTCLVGKNESGKTALLQSVHLLNHLNPIKGKAKFDEVMDYPSRKASAYKKTRETAPATVVPATFETEQHEVDAVQADFGPDVLKNRFLTVSTGYGKNSTYAASHDEAKAMQHLASSLEVPSAERAAIDAATTSEELAAALAAVAEPTSAVTALATRVGEWRDGDFGKYLLDAYWGKWLPGFTGGSAGAREPAVAVGHPGAGRRRGNGEWGGDRGYRRRGRSPRGRG